MLGMSWIRKKGYRKIVRIHKATGQKSARSVLLPSCDYFYYSTKGVKAKLHELYIETLGFYFCTFCLNLKISFKETTLLQNGKLK